MENNLPVKKKRGRKPKVVEEVTVNTTEKADNNVQEVSLPKKRGRKPKVKDDNDVTPVKIPGKRGRKPKEKPENEEVKIPKRRGRKPKNKVYNNSVMGKKKIANDNIIIHLPIKTDKINNNLKETELLTYNPNIEDPKPFESNIGGSNVDNVQFISQQKNPNMKNELTGTGPPPDSSFCHYPFDEKVNNIFEVLDDDTDVKSEEQVENLNKLAAEYNVEHNMDWFSNKDEENNIKRSQGVDKIIDVIKKNREAEREGYSLKNNRSNVEKCLVQFSEANKTQSWPSSTSIYCWWDGHPFDGPPCSLPCDYNNNVFRVCGIFCSPECAAAYNFSDIHSGYDLWERYSLLNFLYRKVYNDNHIKIKLAPPKQSLKIFGGNLSIKDFRIHNSNYNNIYKIIMPPIVSITPIQELSNIDNGYSSKTEKKIFMLEKEKIMDNNPTLKLQRNKPFNTSKNTLEKCMLQSTASYDSESNMSNVDQYDYDE